VTKVLPLIAGGVMVFLITALGVIMSLVAAFTCTLMAFFLFLLIGPALGAPFIGDITFHCALLFEAVPAAFLTGFIATLYYEINPS
jgi:hypothetical protein